MMTTMTKKMTQISMIMCIKTMDQMNMIIMIIWIILLQASLTMSLSMIDSINSSQITEITMFSDHLNYNSHNIQAVITLEGSIHFERNYLPPPPLSLMYYIIINYFRANALLFILWVCMWILYFIKQNIHIWKKYKILNEWNPP